MLILTLIDEKTKELHLKNHDREQSFFEMWYWCSLHCTDKSFKIAAREGKYQIKVSDIKQVTINE